MGSRGHGDSDSDLLSRIDAAVDRMRAVTPDEPYILTIPQDEPRFHHHSRLSADAWLHNTPFAQNENPSQQYQTFFYHEPLSDVFHLHRQSHYHHHAPSVPSTQSTPGMPPKKKISLAAYTNKKTNPDPDPDPDPTTAQPPSMKSSRNKKLPRMLSPLNLPTLPPRPLSPTLPANIIASLDAHPYRHSSSDKRTRHKHQPGPHRPSHHQRQGEDRQDHHPRAEDRQDRKAQAEDRQGHKAPAENLPDHKAQGEDRQDDSPQAEDHRDQKLRVDDHHDQAEDQNDHPPQAEANEQHATPEEQLRDTRDSLMVNIKIPKGMRKNVGRLLATKPNPAKNPEPTTKPPQPPVKRPRPAENDHVPEPKRKKAPSTPVPSAFQSPHKPHMETPIARKGPRPSTAMKRVESVDGGPTETPPTKANGTTTKPSPTSKTAETQAWDAEYARLGKLGRELKHAASAFAHDPKNDTERERAAIASLESGLVFFLSFYCWERSCAARNPPLMAPDPSRTWTTLHAFWKFVTHHCQPFPHLHGLAFHLGVVYNAMIMRRVTPVKADDTRTLSDAVTTGLKSAREGEDKLPLASIVSEFPETWARALEGVGDETVKPGSYEGGFTLPIGLDTDPLHAVRIGHAFLSEWCSKRGFDYKMKLGLAA